MGPQLLSLLPPTTMLLVQIRQRPKWAASQTALWCSTWGLSTAQWSVTTATVASTMPTRMQKSVKRTFSVPVWDMVVAQEWVLWAGSVAVVSPGRWQPGWWRQLWGRAGKLSLVRWAEPEGAGLGAEGKWTGLSSCPHVTGPEGGFY